MRNKLLLVALLFALPGCITNVLQAPQGSGTLPPAAQVRVNRLLEAASAAEASGDLVNAERLRAEAARLKAAGGGQ